jgi:hypothetical protein
MHDRPERRSTAFWENRGWISDPHFLRGGEPRLRPGYRIDDLIVIYISGIRRCPAVARVQEPAVFDPVLVDREARAGDGNRWGWVTEIEILGFSPTIDHAPTLDAIGVDSRSMRRRSRLKLDPSQYRAAERAIGVVLAGASRGPSD